MTRIENLGEACEDACCVPLPLILPTEPAVDRRPLIQAAFRLEWITIGWMVIEAMTAIASGVVSTSLVLLAFGLDSVIELISAGVLMWRLSVELRHGHMFSENAERIARPDWRCAAIYAGSLCGRNGGLEPLDAAPWRVFGDRVHGHAAGNPHHAVSRDKED